MGGTDAKLRVIRGTQGKPLPLLPSGPGGVCSRLLHGARHLTTPKFSRYEGRGRARTAGTGETPILTMAVSQNRDIVRSSHHGESCDTFSRVHWRTQDHRGDCPCEKVSTIA